MTNLRAGTTGHATPPAFLLTKEYRRFAEFCDACRRHRYIGLCYGPPGVGKTLSARHYAQWDDLEAVKPHWYGADRVVPATLAHCHTVCYTPPVANTPRGIEHAVREPRYTLTDVVEEALRHLHESEEHEDVEGWEPSDRTELLIVDEADRLKMVGLEQLRDLYDRGTVGLILIGMPGLEKRLARYPQLYSRIGFAHPFRPLSQEEMKFILTHYWTELDLVLEDKNFTDQEAIAAIIRITGGNFRLLHRLLTQIGRILKVNELQTITQEIVEAARACLVIGTT
jgi:DNA transposition AAA+ family ATPase